MTPPATPKDPRWTVSAWRRAAVLACLVLAPHWALAADSAPTWAQLSASEQKVLQPLEGLWSTIGPDRKQKWREVALRFPSMSVDEQKRIRERMVDWAKLSPSERGAARLGFEQTKALPAEQRVAGWDAYRALPEEQRKALASQASAPRPGVAVPSALVAPGVTRAEVRPGVAPVRSAGPIATQAKSNVVVTSPVQGKPVAPAVVQATVGASTRPINRRPAPPSHQQPGQPKIAATPDYVNPTTLLPQRPSVTTSVSPAATPVAPPVAPVAAPASQGPVVSAPTGTASGPLPSQPAAAPAGP